MVEVVLVRHLPAMLARDLNQERIESELVEAPIATLLIDEVEEALDRGDAAAVAGEIGDVLFAAANLARHVDADPEAALRGTNAKFERRFRFIEAELARHGRLLGEATLDEMDRLWNEAKWSFATDRNAKPSPTTLRSRRTAPSITCAPSTP